MIAKRNMSSDCNSGGAGWAVKSNYPALDSGRVFRLDWFDLFLNFITLMLIVVALFSKVIHQVMTPDRLFSAHSAGGLAVSRAVVV